MPSLTHTPPSKAEAVPNLHYYCETYDLSHRFPNANSDYPGTGCFCVSWWVAIFDNRNQLLDSNILGYTTFRGTFI